MTVKEEWALLDENGAVALEYTSFVGIEVQNEGQALSYPIEKNGFATYNKVQSPLVLRVVFAKQGLNSEFEPILNKLNEYQKGIDKLFISTPSAYYGPVTLETYNNTRTQEGGAAMLVVDCTFIEIREVETQRSTTVRVITKPKNPTSADKTNTGKTSPGKDTSLLTDAVNGVKGLFK